MADGAFFKGLAMLVRVGVITVALNTSAVQCADSLGGPVDIVYGTAVPGAASAKQAGAKYVLSNNILTVEWSLVKGHVLLTGISDELRKRDYPQETELFEIQTDNAQPIRSSECLLAGTPAVESLKSTTAGANAAPLSTGKQISAVLSHETSGVKIRWRAELRDGSHYVRQILNIEGSKGVLTSVTCLKASVGKSWSAGSARAGNPVCTDHLFLGQELPMSKNVPSGSDGSVPVRCGVNCRLQLHPGKIYEFSSVLGVYPEGQTRRAFLRYLERERARPYKPFLHYNCWFDLERRVNETDMLSRIGAFTEEMTVKRGVAMQSYVLDDGWDDYTAGFWTIHKKKFPAGFDRLAVELARVQSHLGIWISPLAGYDGSTQRVEQARKMGLVSGKWLDLSDAQYYNWFRDTCADLMTRHKVNYFKWDKAGDGVSPHFMALLSCARELRRINPDLFVNVTVGTWPSPFWLNVIDSTWREGSDMGWEGKGDDREKWINYRDAQTYRFVVKQGPLYPLNSIMNHGVVMANGHFFATRTAKVGNELRHEARSFFGCGTAVQELYIKPELMAPSSWDAVASAAKWAQENADVLVDTHWVGGDPSKSEIYGWASWSPRKAILTLRNPDDQLHEIALDARVVFELPTDAAKNFAMTSPYADQRIQKVDMTAGKPTTFVLQPFEVLVLESTPTNVARK
jgi:hypothetical protein